MSASGRYRTTGEIAGEGFLILTPFKGTGDLKERENHQSCSSDAKRLYNEHESWDFLSRKRIALPERITISTMKIHLSRPLKGTDVCEGCWCDHHNQSLVTFVRPFVMS